MRKTLLLFGITFLFSFSLNAQTSQDEFNYLKRGIKIQRESGLDVKKGYKLVTILNDNIKIDNKIYNCEIVSLITDARKLKGSVFRIYTNNSEKYIAVPVVHSDVNLFNEYLNDLNDLTSNEKLTFSYFAGTLAVTE